MTEAISEDEIDKAVVDRTGTDLGVVVDVNHGAAHVSADENTVEKLKAELPQGSIDETTYAVNDESVAEITDDRIVLNAEY